MYTYRLVCVCVFSCSPQALNRSQCKMLESLEVIPQYTGPVTAEAYDIIRRYIIKVRPLLLPWLRCLIVYQCFVFVVVFIRKNKRRDKETDTRLFQVY